MMNLHVLAEERSLALHQAVAERLRADPRAIELARDRVGQWIAKGTPHPYYASRWNEVLSWPLQDIFAFLVDPGEEARALRQVSPFAGFVDARDRWRIWRDVRARLLGDR